MFVLCLFVPVSEYLLELWPALITVTQRGQASSRQANMAGLARYLVTSASAV
jgi:hypothetical protein